MILHLIKFKDTHTHAPKSAGLPRTGDQPHAENSTWQQTTLTREDIHAPGGFEPAIPGSDQPQTYDFDSAARGLGISVASLCSVFVSANCTDVTKNKKGRGRGGGRSKVVQPFSDEIYFVWFSQNP